MTINGPKSNQCLCYFLSYDNFKAFRNKFIVLSKRIYVIVCSHSDNKDNAQNLFGQNW